MLFPAVQLTIFLRQLGETLGDFSNSFIISSPRLVSWVHLKLLTFN